MLKRGDKEKKKKVENGQDEEGLKTDLNKEEPFKLIGKNRVEYFRHAAFCLMTQNYPDSVHRKNFPNSILKPGETYHHYVKYKFGVYTEASPPPDEEEIITESISEIEGEFAKEEKTIEDDLLSAKLEENGR